MLGLISNRVGVIVSVDDRSLPAMITEADAGIYPPQSSSTCRSNFRNAALAPAIPVMLKYPYRLRSILSLVTVTPGVLWTIDDISVVAIAPIYGLAPSYPSR